MVLHGRLSNFYGYYDFRGWPGAEARVLSDSPPAQCQLVCCCLLNDVCAAADMYICCMVCCLYGLFVLYASTYVSVPSVCLSVTLGDRASVLVCLSAASHALEAVSAPLRGCKM